MVQEIVFHLGDCKTGTTSIQSVLAARAWESSVGEIVYPARVNHLPLAKALTAPQEIPQQGALFARVRKQFDNSDAAFGVISAEHFEFVDPLLLKAAIAEHLPEYGDRVRLVAYVRPQGERLLSTFAERNKKGLFLNPLAALHDRLAESRLLFYTPRFEKWRALFGDRFSLRPFVRDQLYQGDVVQDFFRYLFGSEAFEITQAGNRNNSLTVEDIAMLRYLHGHLRRLIGGRHPVVQQAFGWNMGELLGMAPYPGGGTRPRLHKMLADRVVRMYRQDAAALDAAFFEGTPISDALEAAPDQAVETAQSFRAVDHYDAAQLRYFDIWAEMVSRLIEADPGHFSWAIRAPDQRGIRPPGQ